MKTTDAGTSIDELNPERELVPKLIEKLTVFRQIGYGYDGEKYKVTIDHSYEGDFPRLKITDRFGRYISSDRPDRGRYADVELGFIVLGRSGPKIVATFEDDPKAKIPDDVRRCTEEYLAEYNGQIFSNPVINRMFEAGQKLADMPENEQKAIGNAIGAEIDSLLRRLSALTAMRQVTQQSPDGSIKK